MWRISEVCAFGCCCGWNIGNPQHSRALCTRKSRNLRQVQFGGWVCCCAELAFCRGGTGNRREVSLLRHCAITVTRDEVKPSRPPFASWYRIFSPGVEDLQLAVSERSYVSGWQFSTPGKNPPCSLRWGGWWSTKSWSAWVDQNQHEYLGLIYPPEKNKYQLCNKPCNAPNNTFASPIYTLFR